MFNGWKTLVAEWLYFTWQQVLDLLMFVSSLLYSEILAENSFCLSLLYILHDPHISSAEGMFACSFASVSLRV